MRWKKLGRVFEPSGGLPWMASHAAIPFAKRLDGDLHRVYFSGRDAKGRAQVGFCEIDLARPHEVLRVSPEPVVGLGPLGAFDDSGLTNSWVTTHGGRDHLYYSGWHLGVTVPFYFHVGCAVSDDGGATFRKVSPSPVLGRTAADPFLTASPCVLVEDGVWRMWYVSGTGWEAEGAEPKHYYHIRYAESSDGVEWRGDGHVCIDYASPDEYAIARPSVVRDGGVYRMWYTYRGAAYRLGYAESPDGLAWTRMDDRVGIDVSPEGWDSEMLAYAHVFDHGGRRWMLYNGNGYGRSGIGLAVLEE